ncbi:MAG: ABC transporter permease [Opitutae bacterium]|nr:ABC transporter permease [Opitutae bacterium]
MLSDFRYVLRTLLRNRGFTLVTVLTLALGIGSGGAIFSATDWILFRRSQTPDGVYLLGGQRDQLGFTPARLDFMVQAYKETKGAISALEIASNQVGNVVVEGQPVDTNWLTISPGLFPMLGITLWRGRGFVPGDAIAGVDQVVIISHKFWKDHLGGREDALGQKIRLGDSVCVVIGILKEAQEFPGFLYRGIYRPLIFRPDPAQPKPEPYYCFARLVSGVTREQAQEALRAAKFDIPTHMRSYFGADRVGIVSMPELLNKYARPEIYRMLLGAVGCLYLIACLNASNLMLVRMLGMRRELGIRLALGGGRLRVIRLLALESSALAEVSAVLGLLVANWIFPLLLSSLDGSDSVGWSLTEWTLDWRVIGVMAGLTVLTGFVISIIPAVRVLRADINAGLKEGGATLGESRALARLRGVHVVLQAAFAVILLAGAGLMIRTFENFQKVELGFDSDCLIKMAVDFPPGKNDGSDWEASLTRWRGLQAEIRREPGVRSVGFGQDVVLPGWYAPSVDLFGPGDRIVRAAMGNFNIGYHETTGIRLKQGRWLDKPQGNEILVNETLARALWPEMKNPVGQFVRLKDGSPVAHPELKGWEVVGVVADIRSTMRDAPGNYIYSPEAWGAGSVSTFVVRLDREYNPVTADALRRRVYASNPQIIVQWIYSVNERRDQQLWAENKANAVFRILAAIALLLAVIGVFTVLAYSVDRRMNEFGVRMALGAMPGDLVRLVMARGVALMLIGLVLGLGGALALTRFLQNLLFETSALDPRVLSSVAGLLLVAAVLACLLPARRAAKVDVSKLLRSE